MDNEVPNVAFFEEVETRAIRIPFKRPYDWEMLVRFLQPRAIPGLEAITAQSYKRAFKTVEFSGALEVCCPHDGDCLTVSLPSAGQPDLELIRERVSRLFDCATDPVPIVRHLGKQSLLRPLLRRHPGIRVPGAFDGFEIAVRAVLGQQITVRAATTMAGRLAAAFGTRVSGLESHNLTNLFPSAAILAEADLTSIGLTRARARAVSGLAQAYLSEPTLFEPSDDPSMAIARLVDIPGIGYWTAQYIAMRVLRDPDGFPASDLGLRRAVSATGQLVSPKDVDQRSSAWRPWRAYAAMHLWATLL
jgi:AraC family transcriptional regulator of adaptative response / DNA-3-methyladenine glycosylase II